MRAAFGLISVIALLQLAAGVAAATTNGQQCAPSSRAQVDVVEIVKKMYVAAGADDLPGLVAVTTDDFYAFDAGRRFTAQTLVEMLKKLHAAGKHIEWNVTNPDVHIACDRAWVTYVNRGFIEEAAGRQDVMWLESVVLEYANERWRIRFFHSTRAAADKPVLATSTPPPKVTSPRLYVFDCGTLINNKTEDYNLKREEVKDSNMGVTCYLVVHPKGILLYDTGLNDRLVGRPLYENVVEGYGQIKFNTLREQLADIGVSPARIDYLVLSHYHWDHVGNAGDFAGSTWLVYKGDRDSMFSSAARAYPWFNQYSALETSKTKILSGDHDVFGDGSVIVVATPGHTEGHCSLLVRLKNTGPVLLSGDLYHYAEERELKRMPEEEKTTGTVESRQKVEDLLRRTGAQLWVGHSMEFFRVVRKSPAWYD